MGFGYVENGVVVVVGVKCGVDVNVIGLWSEIVDGFLVKYGDVMSGVYV